MVGKRTSVHDLLSRDVGTSSSFEETELIGRLQMVFASDHTYDRGTLLLYDVNLNEYIPCRVDYFHPEYLNQDIAIQNWCYICSPDCGIVFAEFEFKGVYLLASGTPLLHEALAADIVRFEFVQAQSIPFLAGRVTAISSLFQQADDIYFMLELNTATIIFQGDDALMYQPFFRLNWYYSFTNTTTKHTAEERNLNLVRFQSSESKVRIIRKTDYERIAVDNNPPNIDQQHMEGTITRVIDIEFGLYELDERHVVCLYDYPQYSPTVFPLRLGIKLSLYHVHVLSLSLDRRHPFIQQLWPERKVDSYYIIAACLKSHISIISFPNHWDFDDTTWGAQEDLYIECISHRYKLTQVLYELALSCTLQQKFTTYPSNIPAINKEKHTEKFDLKTNFMQHLTHCSLMPTSSISIPFYSTLKEIKDTLLYTGLESIEENNTLAGGGGRFASYLVSIQQATYKDAACFLGIIDVGVDGRLEVMDNSQKFKLVLPERDKTSIVVGGLYEFSQFRLIREDLSYNDENDERHNLSLEYIICSGSDLMLRGRPLTNIGHYLDLSELETDSEQQLIGFIDMNLELPSKVFYVKAIHPLDMVNNQHELTMECRVFVSLYDAVDDSSAIKFDIGSVDAVFVFSSLHRSLQHMVHLMVGGWYVVTGLESAIERNRYDISHEASIIKIEQSNPDQPHTLSPIYKHNTQLNISPNVLLAYTGKKLPRKIYSVSEAIAKLRQTDSHDLQLLSVKGIIVTKAWSVANEHGAVGKSDSKKLFMDLGIGTGKENRILLLKLRQTDGLDTIDIYMNTEKQFYPMGLLPGTEVIFHHLVIRKSLQNVYSKTMGTCTYEIIHPGLCAADVVETSGNEFQTLSSFYERSSKQEKAILPISKIFVTISKLFFLELKWTCLNCNSVVQHDSCYGMCVNAQRAFHANCLVEVTDGTASVTADIEGERLAFQLLGLNRHQSEWIKEKAIQSALVYKQLHTFNEKTPLDHFIKLCRQRSYWMYGKPSGQNPKMKFRETTKDIIGESGLATLRVYANEKVFLACQYADKKFKVVEIEQVDPTNAAMDMLDLI